MRGSTQAARRAGRRHAATPVESTRATTAYRKSRTIVEMRFPARVADLFLDSLDAAEFLLGATAGLFGV
jgi:hypothetical protein